MDKPLEVKAHSQFLTISADVFDDAILPPVGEIFERLAEEQRQFEALPAEKQERIRAQRAAEDAAAKAARSCPHCGCDPDEHGGY